MRGLILSGFGIFIGLAGFAWIIYGLSVGIFTPEQFGIVLTKTR